MLGTGKTRETMVSRRKYLLLSGSLVSGGLAGCIGTAQAQTDVTMGELDIQGDSATLNEPPSEIAIAVAGRFEVASNQRPEQVRITLQCHVGEDSLVDDIATDHHFDTNAGNYELTGDLLDHRDVTAEDMNPPVGESMSVPLTIRVILSVVSNGSIVSEEFVESEAPLTITAEGITAQLGGSGSVEIV